MRGRRGEERAVVAKDFEEMDGKPEQGRSLDVRELFWDASCLLDFWFFLTLLSPITVIPGSTTASFLAIVFLSSLPTP